MAAILALVSRYTYPITTNTESYSLYEVINSLKGSDAVIKRVFRDQLDLSPKLKILYEVKNDDDDCSALQVMLDSVSFFPEERSDDVTRKEALSEAPGAVVLRETDEDFSVINCFGTMPTKRIHWVTPLTNFTRITSQYVTYGNEASTEYAYGDICLVIDIPVTGKRLKRKRGGRESEDN